MKRYLEEAREGGLLYGLEPVSPPRAAAIEAEYPGISQQYLGFITHIGVGSCTVMDLYEPIALETIASHPSYQLYQGTAYRRAFKFGRKEKTPDIPAGAIMFADAGASWRYCFGPNMGPEVFCFDLCLLELEPEASDFYEFVDRGLDLFAK